MNKIILSISISLLLCSVVNAEEVKKKSTEELIAEFMKSAKELEEEKARGKALDKLEKTVDKLAKN